MQYILPFLQHRLKSLEGYRSHIAQIEFSLDVQGVCLEPDLQRSNVPQVLDQLPKTHVPLIRYGMHVLHRTWECYLPSHQPSLTSPILALENRL